MHFPFGDNFNNSHNLKFAFVDIIQPLSQVRSPTVEKSIHWILINSL